ncbi:MAG TPA: Crp/Fnr family transcriptional regulator, partial [Terriglobales bacterium]|nr:Crp/Fnr family transcriptional regulator [Terriglobales bacterium]
ARARTFLRHEVVFLEGQPIRHVLLIKSGFVKLTQLSQHGNEVILRLSGAGDIVGVLALSAESHHTCSAYVVETCKGLLWDVLKFESFLEHLPALRKNLSSILAGRLNELEQRFREVATEKVGTRVAHELVRLLKQIGKPLKEGIEVGLSREDLAQMTGTTLFTISRLISEWEQLGLVVPRREAVLVRDAQRLWEIGDNG